jgi:hypothetical protein
MKNFINWFKNNFGIVIIILSFIIVVLSGLINGSLLQAIDSISKANPFYILLGVLCFLIHVLTNCIATRSFIKRQGYDISLKESFFSSMAEFYYASITPAGTGGIPMQIYYLNKYGVPVAVASSAVTCFINIWFFARLILITIFIGFRKEMLLNILGSNIIFLNIGYAYNIYLIFLFFVLGFFKKPIQIFIDLLDKMIRKINLSKDPDSIRVKLSNTADRYHDATHRILKYPSEIIKQFFFGCIYVVSINSIIYFAYRSVGLSGTSYFDLLGMNLCQSIASAYIPTPGGVGGQEIIFSLFFSTIIEERYLLAVMLIWRFISFYLGLIIGAVFTSFSSIKHINYVK